MASACHPLSHLRRGVHGVIDTVPLTDRIDDLAALRLLPGEHVEVIQTIPLGGPVIIRCRTGLYALGRQIADAVWVRV